MTWWHKETGHQQPWYKNRIPWALFPRVLSHVVNYGPSWCLLLENTVDTFGKLWVTPIVLPHLHVEQCNPHTWFLTWWSIKKTSKFTVINLCICWFSWNCQGGTQNCLCLVTYFCCISSVPLYHTDVCMYVCMAAYYSDIRMYGCILYLYAYVWHIHQCSMQVLSCVWRVHVHVYGWGGGGWY